MKLENIHLIEFEKLQKEISQIMSEISTLERYAVGSSGAIFTWLLTDAQKPDEYLPVLSYFLPAILVFAFGLIVRGLYKRLNLIAQYISETYEKVMNLEQDKSIEFGWETYLHKSLNNKGSLLANARVLMWVCLLIIDFAIAIFLSMYNCK